MRSLQEVQERIKEYKGAEFLYTDKGYIVWQLSTGDNYEIIFIEAERGHGVDLLRAMCQVINPYHSVFVVRLASNEIAGKFYRKWGFKETRLTGLYRGDDAVIGVIPYKELVKNIHA